MPAYEPAETRFWRFVLPEPNSGCWLWTGGDSGKDGYGRFHGEGGRRVAAHRFSYELHKGVIPAGLELDHKCRVHCCVNPDHLEPVTHFTNMMRGDGVGSENAAKTHCVRGHLLAAGNLVQWRRGRMCLECHNMHGRAYKARKRAERGLL